MRENISYDANYSVSRNEVERELRRREKERGRERMKNVVTHRKTGMCRFENYGREGESERAKRRKKDVEDLLKNIIN